MISTVSLRLGYVDCISSIVRSALPDLLYRQWSRWSDGVAMWPSIAVTSSRRRIINSAVASKVCRIHIGCPLFIGTVQGTHH